MCLEVIYVQRQAEVYSTSMRKRDNNRIQDARVLLLFYDLTSTATRQNTYFLGRAKYS